MFLTSCQHSHTSYQQTLSCTPCKYPLSHRINTSSTQHHPTLLTHPTTITMHLDKEHKRALEKASHAITLAPNDFKIHVLVAKIHRLMHNLKEAYATIQRSIEMYQESVSLEIKLR